MKKPKFPQEPLCEWCGEDTAYSFSYFKHQPPGRQWQFTCECTSDKETYYVEFDRFFSSPASTTDWLAHLHEKPWMNWKEFMDMIRRFRKATNSFNQI
jgi:hypothetical protein